ncbi:hypothetical protein LTR66_011816 [Elasticomyces elasticus]|nr:hypothetical protein LTR66_011816 [Elasticomyces elasticus]
MASRTSDSDLKSTTPNHPAATETSPKLTTTSPPTPEEALKKAHEVSKPKDVDVKLQYLASDPLYKKVKPLQVVPGYLDCDGKSNVYLQPGETETIHDIRGKEDEFSLDKNGFRYVKSKTNFEEWNSQPKIGEVYLPEMEDLLRDQLEGCDEIMFFDARLRQSGPKGTRIEGLSFNPFARQVHVDQTESSIITKIRNLTEMKAEYLLKGRVRIINVWRPIRHAVYDCALAVADGGTLHPEDVIECDRKRLDTGEFWDTMGVVQYRKGYNWYYMSEQDQDEVVLFKNYDSDDKVAARHCLHTAFDLPAETIPPNAPTRQSIEVRALVFTYPDHLSPPSPIADRPKGYMPSPLATALQHSELKHVDPMIDGIISRLRADLQRGTELNQHISSLHRRELEARDQAQKQLIAERDLARAEVNLLQSRVYSAETKIAGLERRLEAVGWYTADNRVLVEREEYWEDVETKLLERLQREREETVKWKEEANANGREAVSKYWQACVDEAVRREREKDQIIMQILNKELQELRAGNKVREG